MSYLLVSSSKESPTDRLREIVNTALDKTEAEYKRIEAVSTNTYPPIQKVEPCNGFGKRQASISDYEDRYYGGSNALYGRSSKRSVDEVETYCKQLAAEMLAKAEAIHATNIPAIESNTKLVAALRALMTQIGMPPKWTRSDYGSTGRARTKRHYDETAGYLNDISREIKTDDGYQSALSDHKRFLADIDAYVLKRRAAEAEEQRKKDEELAKTEKVRLLGVYQGRYGLPSTATPRDVLDKVLAKNKYLHLAHYLHLNRCDWNDGPSFARAGLDSFTIENETDQAIYDDIEPRISDWDGDGRTFRDAVWSYDAIFGLVPAELKAEYDEVVEWVGLDTLY